MCALGKLPAARRGIVRITRIGWVGIAIRTCLTATRRFDEAQREERAPPINLGAPSNQTLSRRRRVRGRFAIATSAVEAA